MNKLYSTRLFLAAAMTIICGSSFAFANLTHTVAKGENLYRIGLKYGISYKEIMRANNLERTTIHPNQVLVIPSKNQPLASAPKPALPFKQNNSNNNFGALPSLEKKKTLSYATNQPATSQAKSTEEDGLGLGYTPPVSSYPTPSYPAPKPPAINKPKPSNSAPKSIVQAIPAPKSPSWNQPKQQTWNQPKQQAWSQPKQQTWKPKPFRREVPAAAQYSGQSSLNKYPMPSFKSNVITPHNKVHTVKSGENGWKISRCYKVSLHRLKKHNNLRFFQKIRPGMRLVIPD